MRDSFIKKLAEMAKNDPRVFLITGDLGFGVLDDFASEFPNQFLNAGVAEQNMTGLATGLALEGRIVYTYSIGNFPILRCLEQIRNDACYHRANVNIVAIGGGFSYGSLGFSHHATEDLAILRALPEITVVSPGCNWEATEATEALANTPGVGYLRLDKSTAGNTSRKDEKFEIGKARTLRDGNNITLITAGGILEIVLKAAETLSSKGIECRVLSMPTLKPLDTETIFKACKETGGIVTIEEHTVIGGLGGSVAEVCLENGIIPPVFYRIGLREGFSTIVGSQAYLRQRYSMDQDAIVNKVCNLIEVKSPALLKTVSLKN